jgi:hypothetical protein
MPGGCDVVLPSAPSRRFLIGGREKRITAWFEPRMKQTRGDAAAAAADAAAAVDANEPSRDGEDEATHAREGRGKDEAAYAKGGEVTPSAPSWKCGGIDAAVAWARHLVAEQEARGAAPGSVVLAGFSQGAGLAMAAAAAESAWSPVLGGTLYTG